MFKRINKRFRKKEKEEAAGLNDEMKEILGMQDTDSDESDSSSNSEHSSSEDLDSSDSDGESQSAETSHARIAGGLKRQLESDDEEDAGSEADESEQEVNEDAEDGGTVAPMTVVEALSEPLYPVGLSSDARACILCPGKELKHAKMVSVHVASSTHLRRAKRFAALASRVGEEEEDPRLLVAALDESVRVAPSAKSMPKPTRPQKSKRDRRLEKRQRRQERRATKTSASMSPVAKDAQTKRLRSPALSPARLSNPDFQSPADKVLRQKFTRKQTDAVKKHKRDNPRKSSQLHKTARSRRLDV